MKTIILIEVVYLMVCMASCEKIANETDPAKIIIGKWKIIEIGNWPIMETVEDPGGYDEYLPDSIKIEHSFTPPDDYMKNYWIDSLLHERVYFEAQHKWKYTGRYKYEFFDKNSKMRLEFVLGIAEYSTSIYERIK